MKRNLTCYVVLTLVSVTLLPLPDASSAVAVRSGSSREGPAYSLSIPRFVGEGDYVYGVVEPIASNAVLINIQVPPNAEVWFDGSTTMQTGSWRSFVTPALEPGRDYAYEIRARWTEGGRSVEQTRKITIRAGDRETLDFRFRGVQP